MSEFLAGCASGCLQSLIGHPLDTLKVIKQTSLPVKNATKKYISSNKNLFSLNLYRGVSYPTMMSMLTAGLIFDTNARIYKRFNSHYKSGFITGFCIAPIMYFFDTGKIYHQTYVKKGNGNKKIQLFPYRQFLKGNGLVATFGRESLATSLYIGVYFDLAEKTSPLIAGGTAGLASWGISYPVDVIKTRQMNDCSLSFLNAAKQGYLWRGFGVCALRAILVNAAGFWAYDYVKYHL